MGGILYGECALVHWLVDGLIHAVIQGLTLSDMGRIMVSKNVLKKFRSIRSGQMTMNLPKGTEVAPGQQLSIEQKIRLALGQSLPLGSSLPQVHVKIPLFGNIIRKCKIYAKYPLHVVKVTRQS